MQTLCLAMSGADPAFEGRALKQRMNSTKKSLIWWVIVLLISFAGIYFVTLQFGLTNHRQEYGTYGQYNRVLRVVEEMDGYEVVNSRLSRRLDWRNLGYLDSFAVNMRDSEGRTGSIEFVRGSPEMEVRERAALEVIIKAKFDERAGLGVAGLSTTE